MCYLMVRDRDFLLTKVLPRLSKSVVLMPAAVSGSRCSATGVLIMYVLPDAERQGCCAYESVASTLEKCSSDLRSSFRCHWCAHHVVEVPFAGQKVRVELIPDEASFR